MFEIFIWPHLCNWMGPVRFVQSSRSIFVSKKVRMGPDIRIKCAQVYAVVHNNAITLSNMAFTDWMTKDRSLCFITDLQVFRHWRMDRWVEEGWRCKYGRKECVQVIIGDTDSLTYTTTEEEEEEEGEIGSEWSPVPPTFIIRSNYFSAGSYIMYFFYYC